ncbi:unnamed protein product [Spirodela intermedia]|uniref:RING-type domain-containing protein n=2 Tax=Spirodela intermedia TaxID=51605 RepID=A0A7I8KUD1_SPIIN|nr:unnamed protein product [Spirodela intermedia]CAA6664072.1 unnamed protein product [Spirodela intermedia]CAA7400595.1 unnamed protein product [Spirodela intermedia]
MRLGIPMDLKESFIRSQLYHRPMASRHGQKRPLNQALADENDGDEVDIRRPKRDQPMHAVLKCAICWGPMAEETTTTCGHVFCKQCIGAAIRVQKRCPTCRKSLTMRNIHRIYLPTVFSGSSA